jgi:hypothetical protein
VDTFVSQRKGFIAIATKSSYLVYITTLEGLKVDWNDVKSILASTVIPLMKDPESGKKWVAALENCADGERLGICIAIDVISGSLNPQLFADIIENIDPNSPDVRAEFGKIINEAPRCDEFIVPAR